MKEGFTDIWAYLAETPLLGLTVTLLAYQAGLWLHGRSGGHALANPVLLAVSALVVLLWATGTPYPVYFDGAQFVHFLLGPATVALAVPLYRQIDRLRRAWPALIAAIVAGSLSAAASAVAVGWALGAGRETLLSLAPKSVTTPIAMGVAEKLGGLPSLTAVLVILTGIIGAVAGGTVLTAVGVRGPRARGVAIGTAAHGIGTARALQESEAAGAFSGLAMGLNGLATAILLPLLAALVF